MSSSSSIQPPSHPHLPTTTMDSDPPPPPNPRKPIIWRLPDDLIRYIFEIAPCPNFSPVCRRFHQLIHLSFVYVKNVPNDKVIQLFINAQSENLRIVLTENGDVEALKGMMEKLPTVKSLNVTILSPSILYLEYFKTLHKIIKVLSIQYRNRREVSDKIGKTSELVTTLTNLRKYELKLTNAQVLDLGQQVLPGLILPEKVESLYLDFYRNTLTEAGMTMLGDLLRLDQRAKLQELTLDISADQCTEATINLEHSLFYLRAALRRARPELRKMTIILSDNNLGPDAIRMLMQCFNENDHLRSLTLVLNNNPLGDDGVNEIVSRLPNSLKSLELRLQGVAMTDAGVTHLLRLAQRYQTIDRVKLVVTHNNLTDAAIAQLQGISGPNLASCILNISWQWT